MRETVETVDKYLEESIHDNLATEYDNEERHMRPPELTPEVIFLEGGDEAHEA